MTFTFHYRDRQLHCEETPLSALAARYGTPLYVYSRRHIEERLRQIQSAFEWASPLVCYSVKALSNIHILELVHRAGGGFDIVSGGELHRVLKAGGDCSRVVFAGVGKSEREIREALAVGILMFNVESRPELALIGRLAAGGGARVALRLNPDVDPHTHTYTTTGKKGNKFGMPADVLLAAAREALAMPSVRLAGVHVHIGSQILQPEPYRLAAARIAEVFGQLQALGLPVEYINLGGGFGVDYKRLAGAPAADSPRPAADIREFATAVRPHVEPTGARLLLEPGRFVVANAGILITRITFVKQGAGKRFYIVDAGMSDLLRPSLYNAWQEIWPVVADAPPPLMGGEPAQGMPADIVGPICETGDFLGKDRMLPEVAAGELLAVFGAGAYGFTMASNYNSRTRPAEVLVAGDTHQLIRRREEYDDLIRHEIAAD